MVVSSTGLFGKFDKTDERGYGGLMMKLLHSRIHMLCAVVMIAVAALPELLRAQSSTPDSFESLELWVRADSGLSMGSGLIFNWADLSGNERHLYQNSAGAMPTLAAGTLNGHNAVSFPGATRHFIFNEVSELRTVVWVLKEDDDYGPPDISYRHLLGYTATDHYFRGQNRVLWRTTHAAPNVINGSSRFGFEWVNGTSTALTGGWKILVLITDGPLPANMFGRSGVLAGFFKGLLAELMIFNQALSEPQVLEIEALLLDYYASTLDIGPDIAVEYGFCPTALTVPAQFTDVMWNNGATSHAIEVNNSGMYTVAARDEFGRLQHDTVLVSYPGNTVIPDAVTICLGDDFTIDTALDDDYLIVWSNNVEDPAITLSDQGTYNFTVLDTNACVLVSPNFELLVDSFSVQISLGPDREVCSGNLLTPQPIATGIVSYLWNDDSTEPTLVLTNSGEYTLEAVNSNGCAMSDSVQIDVVGEAPVVNVMVPPIVCQLADNAFEVNVTADSAIESVVWALPDGSTESTETLDYAFADWGDASLSVEVTTAAGCSTSANQTFFVFPRPAGAISFSQPCTANSFTVATSPQVPQGGIAEVTWTFNGESQIGPAVSFVPETAGFHLVELSIMSNAGCITNVQQQLQVRQSPVVEIASTPHCVGTLSQFTAQVINPGEGGISSWSWSFGDNTGSQSQNPGHFYPSSGNYAVILNATSSFGCIGQANAQHQVIAPPQVNFNVELACSSATFNPTDLTVSDDPVESWEWTYLGEVYNGQSPDIYSSSTGNIPLQLSVVTQNGCSSSHTQAIQVHLSPVAAFTFTPEIQAPPVTVQFHNQSLGASSYEWRVWESLFSEAQHPTYEILTSMNFPISLTAYNSHGCSHQITRNVFMAEPYLDLIMNQMNVVQGDGQFLVSCWVSTHGTVLPSGAYVTITTGDGTQITEIIAESLTPLTTHYIESNVIISPNSRAPEYVCAEVVGWSPLGTERTPENNRMCKSLTKEFSLFPVFPNPLTSGSSLTVRANLPRAENVQFEVFDMYGRSVLLTEVLVGYSGINEWLVHTGELAAGQYILHVRGEYSQAVQHFQVQR